MKLSARELQDIAIKKINEEEEKAFAWADEQICNAAKRGGFFIRLTFDERVRCSNIEKYIDELNKQGFKATFKSKVNGQILVEWYVKE